MTEAAHVTTGMAGKITVFALGGTIAMIPGAEPGVQPRLSAADLVGAVPALADIPLEAVSFRQKPGPHLSFDDVEQLAGAIEAACAAGARGIVITQGTDTIEEVAFALDLLLDVPVPVVVTGAMRNPSLPGADGPANLLAAVQVAGSAAASNSGVLVVFNDEIHAPRFVTKTHTTSTSTFVSANAGRLGWLSEGEVLMMASLPKLPQIARSDARREVLVPVVPMTLGFEEPVLRAILTASPDALVVDGFGGGHVVPGIVDLLQDAATRVPVLLASRTGAGKVLRTTYGYAGAEVDLLGKGLVDTGWLDARKARILVTLALRNGQDAAGIKDLLSFFRKAG